MVYFASYFVLFFALGALLGFFTGYVYRGMRRTAPAPTVASVPQPPLLPPDDEVAALPGMTAAVASGLAGHGVRSLKDLVELGTSDERLLGVADLLRLEDFALRKWVGMAGLQGLPGVDADLAHALQRIGVRSVADLATENPDRVQNKLAALHDAESLPAVVPDRQAVSQIIEAAG
ncbi:MAG: DUF4332 domain-containing protein [Gammaproteobacteria bacterium]